MYEQTSTTQHNGTNGSSLSLSSSLHSESSLLSQIGAGGTLRNFISSVFACRTREIPFLVTQLTEFGDFSLHFSLHQFDWVKLAMARR
jgi:hypothetical protein